MNKEDDYYMNRQDHFIIISVESRKGGVGKTTVVLNLAKLLMDYYHVLVLDVDVTGTSINAIQNTNVWGKSAKLLTDTKGGAINLLQLFKEQYLTGNYQISFSESGDTKAIKVYSDYVNVIGSELYSEDGSMLYDPSIIFDEIHDYWLLDMIRNVSRSFANVFNDEKNSIIILDNSPGYVGLGKSIHDLLTDMGPDRGKFLSVSSLDIQDIDSCLKAIRNIHLLTSEKENGASFFHDSEKEDLSTLQIGSVAHETFDRLAIGDKELAYYAEKRQQKTDVADYQAIVFNKVPLHVKNGTLVYQYGNKKNEALSDIFDALCGDNPKQMMIPYDESIHYQFFKKNLYMANPVLEVKYKNLEKQLDSLIQRADKLDAHLHNNEWRKMAYLLYTLNRDLGRLPDSLNELGFYNQASHINPEWFPESVFRAMFRNLQDMRLISSNRVFYFQPFLSREFKFEQVINFDYLESFPVIKCAVKSILVVLNSYIKSKEGLLELSDCVEKILMRCLKEGIPKDVNPSWFFIHVASSLANDAYDSQQQFQLSFLEALARVMDLSEDISIICASIWPYIRNADSGTVSEANVSWVVDKKIITKDYTLEKAKDKIYEEFSNSDYMEIVRQVIYPIIVRWRLLE